MAAWSITLSFAGFDHFGLMYDKEASGMFGLKWAVLGSGGGFGGEKKYSSSKLDMSGGWQRKRIIISFGGEGI